MRLAQVRVENFRSIIDSGEIDIESLKTILVGPNEAGKTVLLRAIQLLQKPNDVPDFDLLRDFPRAKYNDITTGVIKPENVNFVTGQFTLDEADKALIPPEFHICKYQLWRKYGGPHKHYHKLIDAPERIVYSKLRGDLLRLSAHMDKQFTVEDSENPSKKPSEALKIITEKLTDSTDISGPIAGFLKEWLENHYHFLQEGNKSEEQRFEDLINKIQFNAKRDSVLDILGKRVPVFILFSNYFKVKPSIHLAHLALRIEQKILDDEAYDYGNLCLLKLLGFTAKELSELGNTKSPDLHDSDALKVYRDRLDTRSYKLNAASLKLTSEIRSVWHPNSERAEADKLQVRCDGQYLKVVVEDDLGVEVELDQRSEGFQWLVSFFVVFFAEAKDKHSNSILLLDEPGTSLHGLKQRDFRQTITRLAATNQTIFTTHSPFLVGPDELDIVRVVEMKNRTEGTKVHTTISSSDPAGLLPLQEALGYDLASSLFAQERNLILEGITDYWYIESTAQLLRSSNTADLNEKIALVFANSAGKVVYYATILHAHKLKVAALLDSDAAGDQAAQQENLVHTLGNKNILRTKDFCADVLKPEIEDLLRPTLINIVNGTFGKDVSTIANQNPSRPIIDIFTKEVSGFSKYKLAKAYIRWTKDHEANDLSEKERQQFSSLIDRINKSLK
ncbi:AAA family ATPase [Undibacterium pigrum]|uniref:AAA ATPase-like protein n=1 Tax=Undibacterium pigrum TaxID=401470 RepID=A0A318IRE4_9BURK|nr:AAA family ATPase [Undibacterium pigrum]PXX37220.1 AAA ATPase-like protein [Undibacterium pigrum]